MWRVVPVSRSRTCAPSPSAHVTRPPSGENAWCIEGPNASAPASGARRPSTVRERALASTSNVAPSRSVTSRARPFRASSWRMESSRSAGTRSSTSAALTELRTISRPVSTMRCSPSAASQNAPAGSVLARRPVRGSTRLSPRMTQGGWYSTCARTGNVRSGTEPASAAPASVARASVPPASAAEPASTWAVGPRGATLDASAPLRHETRAPATTAANVILRSGFIFGSEPRLNAAHEARIPPCQVRVERRSATARSTLDRICLVCARNRSPAGNNDTPRALRRKSGVPSSSSRARS